MPLENEYIFSSKRLLFREWKESDKAFFYKMNSNLEVMKYFRKALNKDESDTFLTKIQQHFDHHGYGLYAVCLKSTLEPIGFIGYQIAVFKEYFTPCVEIGWRLHCDYWNQGYATEGAKALLKHGFETLLLEQVYSFTSKTNLPSQNVMKKIGMRKIDEFEHPSIKKDNPLRPHVLYFIDKAQYNHNRSNDGNHAK